MTTSEPAPRPVTDSTGIATHDARDLVPNGVTANIALDGQVYTLRITQAGNLILTK